ncbi:MAG: hypothetical protein ACXABY_19990 [Candidatus Thorarchaeota archaeon]
MNYLRDLVGTALGDLVVEKLTPMIRRVLEETNFPEGRQLEGALNFVIQATEDKLALMQQEEPK